MSKNRGLRKNRGLSKTPTYRIWNAMMARCYKPSQDSYPIYGGRGIKVCTFWHDYNAFLYEMGEKQEGMSLERKDPDGDYCKANCLWIPLADQARNKRTSRFMTHNGRTATAAEWSELTGITTATIYRRTKLGWTDEEILSTQTRPHKDYERRTIAFQEE